MIKSWQNNTFKLIDNIGKNCPGLVHDVLNPVIFEECC